MEGMILKSDIEDSNGVMMIVINRINKYKMYVFLINSLNQRYNQLLCLVLILQSLFFTPITNHSFPHQYCSYFFQNASSASLLLSPSSTIHLCPPFPPFLTPPHHLSLCVFSPKALQVKLKIIIHKLQPFKVQQKRKGIVKEYVQVLKNMAHINFFEIMNNSTVDDTAFKPKWEVKPRLQRYPTKRWGHTAVLKNKKLYIYGGKTGKSKEPLYQIDCDTLQCRTLELHGFPEGRESHSCSLVGDKLYIWGGCKQEKALNDCICVEIVDGICTCTSMPQFPVLKERQSHATTVMKDKYIFLYGGSNDEDIYDDFWVLNVDLHIWFEIKQIENQPSKRIGCSIHFFHDYVFLFGGQSQDDQYHNELFKISFSSFDFTNKQNVPSINFQLMKVKGKSPAPRSSHSSLIYEDRYLIIVGGQGVNTKGKGSMLLNDVWSYDTVENEWSEIIVGNQNLFKPRSCFSATIYKNKLFLLGGLVSLDTFRSSDQLYVLCLGENKEKKIQACNLCKLYYSIPEQNKAPEPVAVKSGNFFDLPIKNIFKFSKMMKNPFDAFSLLLEAFAKKGYKNLQIDYMIEGKIILLQGGGLYLPQSSFNSIYTTYSIPEEIIFDDHRVEEANEGRIQSVNLDIFSFNIKNACARLGNTFLFVNTREKSQDLLLVTLDNVFYCQLNLESEEDPISDADKKSYEIISNYIRTYNLNNTLMGRNSFNIAITELRTLNNHECQMKIKDNEIELAGTIKRFALLDYIETYFLRKPEMRVRINGKNVEFRSMEEIVENNDFDSEIKNDFLSFKLAESETQSSVSIYRSNSRVGKYIRNKYPFIHGYIELPHNYELSILRHKLENPVIVQKYLEIMIEQYHRDSRKRKPAVAIRELENGH